MSRVTLLAKQLLFFTLYVVFFAVHLHYKYTYVFTALSTSQPTVALIGEYEGISLYKSACPEAIFGLNLKLNKRYIPPDLIDVTPIGVSIVETWFPENYNVKFYSPSLAGCFVSGLTDRGPPHPGISEFT